MTDYINPIDKKPYSEKEVSRVRSLLSDVNRMVKDGKVKEARNTFNQRMSSTSRHASYNKLPNSLRRLARMMFRDIVSDKPSNVRERVNQARARKVVSGGGGMMTTFKKGKSLLEKMKDL